MSIYIYICIYTYIHTYIHTYILFNFEIILFFLNVIYLDIYIYIYPEIINEYTTFFKPYSQITCLLLCSTILLLRFSICTPLIGLNPTRLWTFGPQEILSSTLSSCSLVTSSVLAPDCFAQSFFLFDHSDWKPWPLPFSISPARDVAHFNPYSPIMAIYTYIIGLVWGKSFHRKPGASYHSGSVEQQ